MHARIVAVLLASAIAGFAAGTLWQAHSYRIILPPPARPVVAASRKETDDTDASRLPAFDAELVMYDQPRLLDKALAKIEPQRPGVIDLYVIAFAGDGGEDVFRNEAEYTRSLFSRRFDANGHVLVLENNPATVANTPLATLTNLTWALDAIAAKMDPSQDVLLLYLTSHGSADHQLLVDLDPLPLDPIDPTDLADALDTDPPLRWKVVVVNACFSGGFIDALRSPTTMLITSARSDRSSFGCGFDSDITWFGKAFLLDALNRSNSLPAAFRQAKTLVAKWEQRDHEMPSEPQFASAPAIDAQLRRWSRQLVRRPSISFAPANALHSHRRTNDADPGRSAHR